MRKVYNKLVRDLIPNIIEKSGKKAIISTIQGEAQLKIMLIEKLKEEVEEYCSSQDVNELADILEVLKALTTKIHKLDYANLEQMRIEKEKARGGFEQGIVLEEVFD
jgi:predicted house-cleaning noncanonical NTP pyrophosphatase (MazG superfamily)